MGLSRLAALHGVATSFSPSAGVTVPVPDSTVTAVLAALGVDADTPAEVGRSLSAAESAAASRLLPPTVVVWSGEPLPAALAALPPDAELTVEPERPPGATEAPSRLRMRVPKALAPAPPDGGTPTWWTEPPPGVHRATVRASGHRYATAVLVVAPDRVPQPPACTHGFLVQLYSLLSARSWGMGDLADLADLAAWSGRTLGTGFVQVNPLHAAVPGSPTDPSPYRPSSRRFPDPVHLHIESVPEYGHVRDRAALDDLRLDAAALSDAVLNKGALIDRDAVWELKKQALELVARVPLSPGRRAAYCDYLAEQGQDLEDHALWCALAEVHGPRWRDWPEGLRDPRSARTARARTELMDRVDLHCRLAWLTDTQLAAAQQAAREAGMAVGVVHDLAVGVHPDGADTWAQQEAFAHGMSVGAPPDAFNARGQDWGLPPWRPDALAASGYAPYRALLRGILAHAGALRIDHVMGLFRLWWVPEGRPPTEGTYVSHDAEAMLAVLVLEAHRAGAAVVGEDLGTVEPGVREALARRGVLGTSVLWFERDWDGDGRPLAPERWRRDCVATATTHDLPSTAARLTGDHVTLRHRLGLLTRPLEQELAEDVTGTTEWLSCLARLRLLPEGEGDEEAAVRAVHRFLLRTPARMTGIWLPDTVGDRRPQNLPGTWDQYPNWRLPVADAEGHPVTLEEIAASPRLHRLMEVFRPPAESSGVRTAPPGARRP
ncbi:MULTISPECIES: 4-alpha-glucanotransferase [unclassified Streptomyces]|uniref:4-alpha-glucanotransferase n=1 Tax=unclassified Streptomyces TaxID=2593676 RepID=UPI0001C1D029|nr:MULTISPECIES: 4-alpha-glucanotransferase [unclassified Streptomyces]AEN09979.1 4-alpha-glucanotransferase [Streptomyces sp. SirexAA-E]MYR67620.1 4-alpha-glucanotransferase [Streptomyces sp. SID4939]MYS02305.1 4-alpha-glucanotransferase [Streptomyces sp. SID4940]MYT65004.1 4-alpha-glucanotransferase [Streptomyces sp. SID8357]MYT88967.1 4-alpha-glucanotransferase [Streptomyces sp. SID8360]